MGVLGYHRAQTNQNFPEGKARRIGESHLAEANFHCVTDRQEDAKLSFQIWPDYPGQEPTSYPQYSNSDDSRSLRAGYSV